MQQHKIVEAYLDSVIPKKISESKKAEIRAEIESHIYDRAEFYIEIGYDEDKAFEMAVERMGEGEAVKVEFESIYNDSTLKGILLFFGMCTINLLSVSWLGLGYWYFVEPSMHHVPSIVELAAFLAGFVFLTVYTIKCCRQKLNRQLAGMTAAYGLMAFASIITSGLFYPIFNAGYLVCCYLTNSPEPERDLAVPVNIVVLVAYAAISFMSLAGESKPRKKPYRLSLKKITVILSFLCICFLAVYGFAYEKYEWLDGVSFEETLEEEYISNITAEHKNVYDTIKIGDNINDAEKLLTEKGYEKYGVSFEEFLDKHLLPYDKEEFLKKCLPNSGENYCATYRNILCLCEEDESESAYTDDSDDGYDFGYGLFDYEDYDYGDVVSFILVFYDDSGKINQRLYLPDVNLPGFISYLDYNHGEETERWFAGIQKGDDCETALKFVRSVGSYIIEYERSNENITKSVYNIYLDCYYPLNTNFIDFLFGNYPESVNYSFIFVITAENGIITDFEQLVEDY